MALHLRLGASQHPQLKTEEINEKNDSYHSVRAGRSGPNFNRVASSVRAADSAWRLGETSITGIDESLSIKLKDGKKVSGKFSSANDSELTIIRKGRQQVIARDSIAQVHHLKRKAEKAKYAAIGAGIGAGAGTAIGGAKANSASDDGCVYTIVGVAFGTGFGALGGLLFGQGKRKHVLIYEAP